MVSGQNCVTFKIYYTEETDPVYVSDPGMVELGEVTIPVEDPSKVLVSAAYIS